MQTVIAAVDNSAAARPVLAVTRALVAVMDGEIRVVHVPGDGHETAAAAAAAAEVELELLDGDATDPVASLAEVAVSDDVAGIVLGMRDTPAGPFPCGSTALAVAAKVDVPVVLVPPDVPGDYRVRRVLVPMEGTPPTARSARGAIQVASAAGLELVVLHVWRPDRLPPFSDQPVHERESWARAFLGRYVGVQEGDHVRLVERVGNASQVVPEVAEALGVDLVALGWLRDLSPGHGEVVRTVLERSRLPVLLNPVQ